MTLTIPGRLPSLNEYTRKCRSGWAPGAKMKSDAEDEIKKHIEEQLGLFQIKGTATLRFRWYEKNDRRDLDNVCFAKKFILDALVDSGILETDGWKGVAGFTDEFFIDKDNPRIEIDIEGSTK